MDEKPFKPGGEKGKLHRKLGVPIGERIPHNKLIAATHSKDAETRDMAIHAVTMMGWKHKGRKKAKT